MGAMLSAEAGLQSMSRLASRDVCDEETWGNTLRNRSTHTVHDHLGGLVAAPAPAPAPAFFADAVCEEFPLSFVDPPASPAALAPPAPPSPPSPSSSMSSLDSYASSGARRRRLEFAPENEVAFYCADAPPQEVFGRDQVRVL